MPAPSFQTPHPALLLIDLQRAIDHPSWGQRNQPQAEDRVQALLAAWRKRALPIAHVRHFSKAPESTYRPGGIGVEFKPGLGPLPGEPVFTKSTHAAFVGTALGAWLHGLDIGEIVIAGVITDNSVEATARLACDLGFRPWVVSDACFTFGRCDLDGKAHDAAVIHALSLSRLHAEYAEVWDTATIQELLQALPRGRGGKPEPPRQSMRDLPQARRWRAQAAPAAVVGVLLTREHMGRQEKLLLKRNHAPYAGLWSLPGGKWEFGETLAQAALREAQEETGLDANFDGLLAILDECLCPAEADASGAHFLLHLCALRAGDGTVAASHEGEVRWFSDAEIERLAEAATIVPSDHQLLAHLDRLAGVGHFEAEVAVDAAGQARLLRFSRLG